MGEMKHTPGEWVADRDCDYGKQPRVHAGDRLVCVVGNSETDRQDQWEADAALIAAVKDVCAALQETLPYLIYEIQRAAMRDDGLGWGKAESVYHSAREALDKAGWLESQMDRFLKPGDVEPHNDVERTVRVVRAAYGWTVNDEGRVAGLVAGDMGYESTHIVIDLEELRDALWLKPDVALSKASPSEGGEG